MSVDDLKKKIDDGTVEIGTIGLGYVGLPLAVEFASAGLSVLGFDVDENKVCSIRSGRSYVPDVDGERLQEAVENKRLDATMDFDRLAEPDAVIICVPTPLSKTKDPDLSFVVEATRQISDRLRRDQLVVLESTTYPGTTEEIILPMLAAGGLTVGEDFFLAFSPERVDPGNAVWHTRNTPKIIGGMTSACLSVSTSLYARAVDEVIAVSSTRAAEMVKLLENTFRSVNIGLVNEVALMCNRLGVDVWEVIDAAASKPFGFMPFYPGPGLGGHCIPVDPYYLSWKLKTLNYRARFIELAGEVNSEMPFHVVSRIQDALNDRRQSVKGARVLLVGVSYKPDVDDVRESPALDLLRLLEQKGAEVSYHDPYVPRLVLDGTRLSSRPLAEALAESDCVVIVTNHSCLDVELIVRASSLLIDTRNATKRLEAPNVKKL
ncbi:MAG TPA: nucleotide sugar dehydrogenase [Vicinamibacteria bacterium]|nr:nucleotide sugar dehydrogenase [Vicinamibacteria bacterium]